MKNLKESGTVSIGGGNFNSDGPALPRRTSKYFSGHQFGSWHGIADDHFGGIMGLGRVNKALEEEEDLEEDIDEVLLQEFKLEIPSLRTLMKGLGSVPVFGSIPNALSFLFAYFGPGGLTSSLSSFTNRLGKMFDEDLGDDFLETEYDQQDSNQNLDLDEKLNMGLKSILEKLEANPDKEIKYIELAKKIPAKEIPEEYIPLSKKSSIHEIKDIIKKFDDITDQLQYCMSAFFKIFGGAFAQIALNFTEPIDFLTWLTSVFIKDYKAMLEEAFESDTVREIAEFIGKPIGSISHFDIFINQEKLNRLSMVLDIMKKMYELRDMIEGKNIGSLDGEEKQQKEKYVSMASNLILNQIFENKNYKLTEVMKDFIEEEEFDEIDLEEYSVVGGISGYSMPTNRKKEDIQKEQIERMRMLEAYHQKTTNRLK